MVFSKLCLFQCQPDKKIKQTDQVELGEKHYIQDSFAGYKGIETD